MIQTKDKSKQLKLNKFTEEVIICELCGEAIESNKIRKLDDLKVCEFCYDKEVYER